MKLTEAAFLHQLAHATRQAEMDRRSGRSIREAIERTGLPLPRVKDLKKTQRQWDAELANDPIYAAVEMLSRGDQQRPNFYKALAVAKDAWDHYKELPDPSSGV